MPAIEARPVEGDTNRHLLPGNPCTQQCLLASIRVEVSTRHRWLEPCTRSSAESKAPRESPILEGLIHNGRYLSGPNLISRARNLEPQLLPNTKYVV